MGDRQTFQLMPAAVASGAPSANRAARALSFSHADETAHAHTYRVAFDDGIVTEIAPTDHAAMFRFTFRGDRSQLVFDNRDDHGGITLDPSGPPLQRLVRREERTVRRRRGDCSSTARSTSR